MLKTISDVAKFEYIWSDKAIDIIMIKFRYNNQDKYITFYIEN